MTEQTRPPVFWILVAGCVAILLGIGVFVFLSKPPLNLAGYDAIEIGMTRSQVEELFCGPPGDYGHRWGSGYSTAEWFRHPPGSTKEVWFDDNNRFEIYFDSRGVVVAKHSRGFDRERLTFRELQERILGWF